MSRPVHLSDVRKVFKEARETTCSGHMEFNVNCPFPHRKGRANFKMYINGPTGVYHCCDCGASGSFWDEFTGASRRANGRILAGKWDSKVVRDTTEFEEVISPTLQKIQEMPIWRDGIHAPGRTLTPLAELPDSHPAVVYMRRERRLDPAIFGDPCGPWKACYCEDGISLMRGTLTTSGRIVIPFIGNGRMKGWTTRKIEFRKGPNEKITWDGTEFKVVARDSSGAWPDRSVPKYFHLPSMNKSTFLYNTDQAALSPTVWVFEGPLDVWAFGPDAVCFNGEFPSAIQCRILSGWDAVRWGMDPEVDLTDSVKAKRHHRVLRDIEVEDIKWRVLQGGDPADLGREEVIRQFQSHGQE